MSNTTRAILVLGIFVIMLSAGSITHRGTRERASATMTREPDCTGWIDPTTLECRHGLGGSGMTGGRGGYLGPCGAAPCK